jgi:hydrophobic/amphiphilic exporter-1 (mainly G- bacteria), HAE1 family
MNFTELFIKRPIMTSLVMFGILLFGVMGYRLLPVSDLPNVDFPTIQVTANLPGANPDTMASSVATPLEKQFSTIAGIASMNSVSAQGITQITIQFELSRDLDGAALDVESAIATAASQLPPQLPTPPTFLKVNPADQPIIYLALTSPLLPLYTLDDYAETRLAQRISTLSGVAQVLVYGSQKYAVRVQVDPNEMAARGIGIDEVQQAISNSNVNLPLGILYGPRKALSVQANGQLFNASNYLPLIIAYRNGYAVRVRDIGRAIDSVQDNKTAAWYITHKLNQTGIILGVQRQPGTNTVEVANAVKAILPAFRKQLPVSADLRILYDYSTSISDSINDVKFTLTLTIILVILVIFLFLRNLSATVIPSLALPFSLVGTFAVMYMCNYSLDNLSLMALTLSVGFVVDDAIVMLENIVRHMEHGESVMEASLNGSKEIGFTILSMTISLAAVFIPILFMGGLIGRLFHEFAVTIGSAILVSGFVSLTLTPMLCSRFLRPHDKKKQGRFYTITERGFQVMLNAYESSLKVVLKFQVTMIIISFLMLICTIYLFIIIPKGFIPDEDNSQISAFTESIQGISYDELVRDQNKVSEIIQQDPNVQAFMSSIGSTDAVASNVGTLFIVLKSISERVPYPGTKGHPSVDDVIQVLRVKLSRIPGMSVYLQNPPSIQIGGLQTTGIYQLTLQGPDTNELYKQATDLEQKMHSISELQDVNSDLQNKNPQINIAIDRDRAKILGISAATTEDLLYSAFAFRQISSIYAPDNEYQVILELEPQFGLNPDNLSLLYVHSASGQLVPLSTIAKINQNIGPLLINHTQQLPSVTISFNLKPNVALGDAIDKVNKLAHSVLSPTISTNFAGTAQAFQSSLQGLGWLLIMAILVIYMVLGILYESYVHPITILSGLPSAGIGALLTLLIFRVDLNIYSFVGVIMLVGLVKKNAIMMIDFALEAERKEGKSAEDAIFEGCMVRFRPIMMTTMAALMGTLPIALGYGAGAEARRPLGLAVVGGLLFSQFVTLYITPVFYIYMEKFRLLFSKRVDPAEPIPETQTKSPNPGL